MNRTQILIAALAALASGCDLPNSAVLGDDMAPVSSVLLTLPIAPEDTGAHYDRDEWPHWSEQGGGCSTRDVVLQRQAVDRPQVGVGCRVGAGRWVSAYDGVTVTDPGDLDVDHVVPLAEVARSGRIVDGRRVGPRTWSREQREAYANDLAGLVAVTASSNRSKGDDDPARWLPDRDRCGYVAQWIDIKVRYDLSVDPAEHEALTAVLTSCPGGGGDR